MSGAAGRATDELQAKLDELRAGLDKAEREVEKYRAEHDLVDAQGKLISDDELVKLNEQLSIARARTIELNARAQSTRSINVDAVLGGGLPEELASSVMSELRSQYAAMKQEADQLSVRLGPRHPQYLAMQAQLKGAREQIANELRRIVATVQTDLKRAVQQEQDLAARLAQLKVRSGDVNVDLVTLRELEREAAAKRAVYEGYLLRAKETGEQRGINTANMSVISPAFPPIDPIGPSRATITLAGGCWGSSPASPLACCAASPPACAMPVVRAAARRHSIARRSRACRPFSRRLRVRNPAIRSRRERIPQQRRRKSR